MVHLEFKVEQDTPKVWSLAVNKHVVLLLHLVCIRLITLCEMKLVYPSLHNLLASHTALLTSMYPFVQFQWIGVSKHAESWSTKLFEKLLTLLLNDICVLRRENQIRMFMMKRTPIVRQHNFYSHDICVMLCKMCIAVHTL